MKAGSIIANALAQEPRLVSVASTITIKALDVNNDRVLLVTGQEAVDSNQSSVYNQ